MKQIIFLFTLLLMETSLKGQSLKLNLPAFAGDTVFVLAHRGIQVDTIAVSHLDKSGTIHIEKELANCIAGIYILNVKNGSSFGFIWSGKENMEIYCKTNSLDVNNVIFNHSMENDSLNTWFNRMYVLVEKLNFCQQGLLLYKNDIKRHFFEDEKQYLENEKTAFEQILSSSSLYAARYMQLRIFANDYSSPLGEYAQDSLSCEPFRRYWLNDLDMETLYSSDQWYNIINTSLELYRPFGDYQEEGIFRRYYVQDAIHILSRILSQDVYNAFAADLLEIGKQFGWQSEYAALTEYLKKAGRYSFSLSSF
jgi:hypothetical protein